MGLLIDGRSQIGWSAASTPDAVAWGDLGVEVVLECSGRFRSRDDARRPYLARGVRKVVVAAPVKDGCALNVVVGVNDDRYDPDEHDIVTAASCTTNCLAPVVKVLHEGIGDLAMGRSRRCMTSRTRRRSSTRRTRTCAGRAPRGCR